MTYNLRNFIEENINLVDSYEFYRLYKRASENLTSTEISELTEAFFECEVNPLEHMSSVPSYFLTGSKIDRIEIPHGIRSIGAAAFECCKKLEIINLPSTLEVICGSSFADCHSLKEITIPGVTEIGLWAFSNAGLERVKILDGCKVIRYSAFELCNKLTQIELPSSLSSIEENIFDGCVNQIDIIYRGTKSQWKAMKKDPKWNRNCDCVIHCTNGEVIPNNK